MPDQSNGQRLWALVQRGPQASAILFPRCLKRSIRLKSKITSFFSVFTKACLSGRWEIVPWRWSVAVKCPEGGSRCFGRLKRKHSLDYIHARLHKVCKNHPNDFLTFLMATVYLQLQQARWCAECDYRQSWRSTEPGRHRVPGLPRKRFPFCSRRVETRGLEAQPSRRISLEDQCHEHRGTSSGYVH